MRDSLPVYIIGAGLGLLFFLLGFSSGRESAYKDAHGAGVGQYVTDPETGNRRFKFGCSYQPTRLGRQEHGAVP